jgi:biotin carboxyl carrier protein
MPGKVVRLLVEPGTAVAKGQPLLVVEAMKMQNEIAAPRDGTIKTVHAKPGAVVERGTLLVEAGPA